MSSIICRDDSEVIEMLESIFANNESTKNYRNVTCNITEDSHDPALDNYVGHLQLYGYDALPNAIPNQFALKFYAYITPLIILIGLAGNIASLFVFTSHRLRGLSASHYLAALSASDTIVLLTYVLLGWLNKGLPQWPGKHQVSVITVDGVCHLFLFFSYAFRFISVYLVVVFTIERYVAVCKPLKRRIICTRHFARKLIILVVAMGIALSIYKPCLSGVYDASATTSRHVTGDKDKDRDRLGNTTKTQLSSGPIISDKACMANLKYDKINYIMEVTYGVLITIVPFILMLIFNILIIHRLVVRFTDSAQVNSSFRENRIRWEFTVMLLAVSTCFIALNIPYNVVWLRQFFISRQSGDFLEIQKLRSQIYITRTVFTLNYCINFFVYCLTGSYYRGVITEWFRCNKAANSKHNNGYHAVRIGSISTQGTVV